MKSKKGWEYIESLLQRLESEDDDCTLEDLAKSGIIRLVDQPIAQTEVARELQTRLFKSYLQVDCMSRWQPSLVAPSLRGLLLHSPVASPSFNWCTWSSAGTSRVPANDSRALDRTLSLCA